VKVFITGVSSFTGCHIARAFCRSSFQGNVKVYGTLTKKKSDYSVIENQRLSFSLVENWIEEASFGSKKFLDDLSEIQPDVFINHGASIKGYREKDFDIQSCVAKALVNIGEVFDLLPKNSKFIHSGSIFEKDLERSYDTYSIYGLAKSVIWDEISKMKKNFFLSKIVIPDPVGVYENQDRLAPVLFRKWKLGERIDLKNPDVIQDRIPASWLAQIYVEEAFKDIKSSVQTYKIRRPSGFCKTNLEWVQTLATYFEKKTGKSCPGWNILPNVDSERKNTEPVAEVLSNDQCDRFFNEYSDWLLK
jgi:hypothetical protein